MPYGSCADISVISINNVAMLYEASMYCGGSGSWRLLHFTWGNKFLRGIDDFTDRFVCKVHRVIQGSFSPSEMRP